jgi:hypothetical protein
MFEYFYQQIEAGLSAIQGTRKDLQDMVSKFLKGWPGVCFVLRILNHDRIALLLGLVVRPARDRTMRIHAGHKFTLRVS